MTTLWRSHIDLAQCGRSNHHTLTQSAFAQGYHDGPSTTHIYDTSLQAHPYEPDHSQPQSTHMQHGKNHTPHADGHYSEHGSNMHNANIHTASMHSANMHSANMQSANMHSVDMQSVDMQGTNMQFMNRASMRHINMPTQCGKQSPAYATPRNLPTMYPSAPSPPTHVQAPNASMYEQPSGLYGHTSEMYEQLDGMYYKQPPVLYNQSPAMQEQPLPGQDDYPYTRRQPRHGDSSCCRGDSSCCSRTHQSRSSFELPTRSQSTNRKSSFAGARRTSLSATRISLRDLSNGPSRPMWQPVQRVLPPPTSRNHWQAVAAHPDGSPTQSMQMHASPTLEDSLPRQAEASCPKQVDGTTTRPDAELPTARPCVATQPCILGKPSATTEALAPQPLGPSIPGVSLQAGATLAPAPIALKLQSSPAFTANANRTAEPSTDEKRTQLIARQMMKRLADPAAAVASLRRANPRLSEGMSDEQLLVRLYEHIASGHAREGIEKEQKMSGEKKEGHTKEVEAEEVQGRELEGRISAESGALREEEEINSATMQEEDSHGYMVSHRFTYKCWGKNLDCLVVYLAMSPRILLCHRLIDKRLCPILVKKCVDWRPPLSTTLQLKDEVETVDYLIPSDVNESEKVRREQRSGRACEVAVLNCEDAVMNSLRKLAAGVADCDASRISDRVVVERYTKNRGDTAKLHVSRHHEGVVVLSLVDDDSANISLPKLGLSVKLKQSMALYIPSTYSASQQSRNNELKMGEEVQEKTDMSMLPDLRTEYTIRNCTKEFYLMQFFVSHSPRN